MRRAIAVSFLLLALASCGLPRDVVVLLPDEDGKVGRVLVRADGKEADFSQPLAAVGTTPNAPAGQVFAADPFLVQLNFQGALAATPRPPQIFIVGFLNGTADVDPASQDQLAAAIKASLGTPFADIGVVGHSDATGSDAENLALSLKRANAVRDALVAAGVKPDIIAVSYHGSSNPRVPRPRGVPEPANRRVEVTIR